MRMFLNKKGDIWISAVIYTALGVAVLTLILSAGVPLVAKMKDRNAVVQTKSMMNLLDDNIRSVAMSGPAAQRFLELDIGAGQFDVIDNDFKESVHWNMTTKAKMQEPNITIGEGSLITYLAETQIVGEYVMSIELNYTDFANITINPISSVAPYTGHLSVYVKNIGNNVPDAGPDGSYRFANLPVVQITLTG